MIIDDVRKKDLKNVVRLIVAEYIKIEKQGEDPIIIEPHLYIISNELELEHLNASILARSTVYTCTENLEHEINRTIHHPEGIDQVFNAR